MVLANNVSSKSKLGGNILDSGKRVEEGLKIMWNSGVIGLKSRNSMQKECLLEEFP